MKSLDQLGSVENNRSKAESKCYSSSLQQIIEMSYKATDVGKLVVLLILLSICLYSGIEYLTFQEKSRRG